MEESKERKRLELDLQQAIKQGEEIAFQDPEVKEMVSSLRNMFENDEAGMLSALGFGSPPPQSKYKRIELPPSKIPQLILMLNEISKKKASINRPGAQIKNLLQKSREPQRPSRQPSSSSSNSGFHSRARNRDRDMIDQLDLESKKDEYYATTPDSPTPEPASAPNQLSIRQIEREIHQAQEMLDVISRDREAIRQRQGTYAIPGNRLKAERLLRELPGRIAYLQQKKQEIESGNI